MWHFLARLPSAKTQHETTSLFGLDSSLIFPLRSMATCCHVWLPGAAPSLVACVAPWQILAAMAPCMRLYAFLGRTVAAAYPAYQQPTHAAAAAAPGDSSFEETSGGDSATGGGDDDDAATGGSSGGGGTPSSLAYASWVQTYSSDDFAAAAATVERLLDRLGTTTDGGAGAGAGAKRYETLLENYRTAMALEYNFFDAQGYEAGLQEAGAAGQLEVARAALRRAAGPGTAAAAPSQADEARAVLAAAAAYRGKHSGAATADDSSGGDGGLG
ncbi:unnamed protein product [Phaeothamnion confervicola]